MTRDEAKNYVKSTLLSANGRKVALVLRRYFSTFPRGNRSKLQTQNNEPALKTNEASDEKTSGLPFLSQSTDVKESGT